MNFSKLKKVYIIAEAGVNHNGDMKIAYQMIKEAKKAGADAIKFQNFSANNLALKSTPKTTYQKKNMKSNKSHYKMLKDLEISQKQTIQIIKTCKKYNIDFISTPYDVENAKFLVKNSVKLIKVSSADLVDTFLHNYLSSKKISIIISTGMSDLSEITQVMKIYKKFSKDKICLLHCVSNYPCKNDSLNLNGIDLLKEFKYVVGFSDHTSNDIGAIVSVAKGCKIIEKHFTLDKNLPGPDHKASLNIEELKQFVKNIRIAERSIGKKVKECQSEELNMKLISRKSIVTSEKILKNQKINLKNIKFLRPGTGISPLHLNKVLNKRVKKNINANVIIKSSMFE